MGIVWLRHYLENEIRDRGYLYVRFPVDESVVKLEKTETKFVRTQVIGNSHGKRVSGYAFLHNGETLFIPSEVEHHVNVSSEIGVNGVARLLEKCKGVLQRQKWGIRGIPLTREMYIKLPYNIQNLARHCLLSDTSDIFKSSLEYAEIGSYVIASYDGCHEFGICTMAVLPPSTQVDLKEDDKTAYNLLPGIYY